MGQFLVYKFVVIAKGVDQLWLPGTDCLHQIPSFEAQLPRQSRSQKEHVTGNGYMLLKRRFYSRDHAFLGGSELPFFQTPVSLATLKKHYITCGDSAKSLVSKGVQKTYKALLIVLNFNTTQWRNRIGPLTWIGSNVLSQTHMLEKTNQSLYGNATSVDISWWLLPSFKFYFKAMTQSHFFLNCALPLTENWFR